MKERLILGNGIGINDGSLDYDPMIRAVGQMRETLYRYCESFLVADGINGQVIEARELRGIFGSIKRTLREERDIKTKKTRYSLQKEENGVVLESIVFLDNEISNSRGFESIPEHSYYIQTFIRDLLSSQSYDGTVRLK